MRASAEAALFLAGKAAALIGIVASCWLSGALLLPRRDGDVWAEHVLLASTLGLAALAQALLLLGIAGVLTPLSVAALLLGAAGAALILRRGDLLADWRDLSLALARVPLLARLAAVAVFALLCVPALRPPSAFDETLYHLPYARAFAESGTLGWLPDLRFPIFPQTAEALFAACLLLADDVTTHLVPLFATVLAAAIAAAWGHREAGARAGVLAAALILGEPVVAYHAGVAYVDPLLMLFVTGCFYALGRAVESGQTRWILLSGVLAGTAASVKYHGLYFAAAAGALVLLAPPPRARRLVLFTAGAVVALLPTYGRLVAETSNPFFPFFPSIFGESPWSDWGRLMRAEDAGQGPVTTAGDFLSRAARYPLDLLLRRGPFWHPPVSPLLMASAAAGAVFAIRRRGPARSFLAVGAGYVFLILFLSPDPRYLMPLAPGAAALGAVAAARGLSRLDARRGAGLTALLALVALAPGMAYLAQLEMRRGLPVVTSAARERDLEKRLPHYRAIRTLNERHGAAYSLYAFGAEAMAYFAQGRFRGDHYGPWAYQRIRSRGHDRGSLGAALSELSATHLLVPRDSRDAAEVAKERLVEEYRDEATVVYRLRNGPDLSRPRPPA